MTTRRRAAFALLLGLMTCAPPEADYELSERARAAPAPLLTPTAGFDAPLASGAEAAVRLSEDTAALATRAAALRERGAALSSTAVVPAEARDRLSAAPGNAAPP